MRLILAISNALADETRVRAVLALQGGELCVCQLIELLGLAPSTISKHLFLLKQAQLIESRKEGRWIHYRLAGDDAPQAVRDALAWLFASAAKEPDALDDAKRLKTILKQDPEDICKRQMQSLKSCSCAPATPAAAKWRKAGLAISRAR